MKTIIPTIGTRGDIQPYIALGLGLRRAGHEITLASHPCMRVMDFSLIVAHWAVDMLGILTGIILPMLVK